LHPRPPLIRTSASLIDDLLCDVQITAQQEQGPEQTRMSVDVPSLEILHYR